MDDKRRILAVSVLAALLSLISLTGYNDGQQSLGGAGQAAAQTAIGKKTPSPSDARGAANFETFVTYKYTDPMTGMEAFRLLIPKGWRADGSITWSQNPALPAQARFRFSNPNGTEEFNLFPTQAYFWTNNQMALATNPPGSLRFGTLVMSPIDLNAAFTRKP